MINDNSPLEIMTCVWGCLYIFSTPVTFGCCVQPWTLIANTTKVFSPLQSCRGRKGRGQTVFVEWVTQEGQKNSEPFYFILAVFLFWKGEAGKPQSFPQRAQHPQPPPPPSSSPSPPSSPAGPDQIFCQSAKCSCHLVAATLSPPKKESTEFLVDVITTITITAITITVATWWS